MAGAWDDAGGQLPDSGCLKAVRVAVDIGAAGCPARVVHRRVGGNAASGEVVLGVLREGAVEAEAGGERRVGCVCLRVSHTGVRRYPRRVGGELVEEEVEVRALAALREQFGQRGDGVEGEVPYVGVADDFLPWVEPGMATSMITTPAASW